MPAGERIRISQEATHLLSAFRGPAFLRTSARSRPPQSEQRRNNFRDTNDENNKRFIQEFWPRLATVFHTTEAILRDPMR